jgi:3-hydroxyacyl-[acyl-carrier-protein] dehydratase
MRWQFVDEIIDVTPGVSIKTVKFFSNELELFKDHFPQRQVLPGVLQIECIASAVRACAFSLYPNHLFYLALVKSSKFRLPIKPPARCEIFATVKTNRFPYVEGRGKLSVEGRLCSEAYISLMADEI